MLYPPGRGPVMMQRQETRSREEWFGVTAEQRDASFTHILHYW